MVDIQVIQGDDGTLILEGSRCKQEEKMKFTQCSP